MSKEYENALRVIAKPPEKRLDNEIHQLVPWMRSKAKLFKSLKTDILADIIRNCDYVTKYRDDVIIKQGDIGDCFYIVLHGKVTIYILNKDQLEGEEDDGNFDNIIQFTKDGALDRAKLGYCVTSLESGTPFGDVALTSGDSIRTASIVADERTDLLVVDRALYNRSMKEVLAKEFLEKTTFIKNNPLFSNWSPRYRKQLAMALYKDGYPYESALVRQGDRTTNMYFILSGQVEIQVDPSHHPQQYAQIFKAAKENEVDKLIRKVKHTSKRTEHSNHQQPHHNSNNGIKRRDTGKCMRLCHLGVNESVGDVELTMDLHTYMQTAICKESTEVLVLEHKHYERLFTRRHPRTIDLMRDETGVKLASRLSMLNNTLDIPFIHYLIKLIESKNKPVAQNDKGKDEHTVSTAEKEFLNHKGPLIDLHGPGSVFFLINLREKTKLRVKAKRGERIDRLMPPIAKNALMAAASNQTNSTPDARVICGRYLSTTDQPRSFRDIQNSLNLSKVEAEDGQDEENYQESRGGYSRTSRFSQDMENAEDHDAKLGTLENRLREWLQTDNPRGKPQVAQLRRLGHGLSA
ncbi:uncharacterized protein LOC131936840 isoform X2 [Physella acuta]|uniref:uncharacterized protein LOC131936840 isoform X2 n=1 Tax=Physella acuta TaxID=109671 RepID=UPI0027DD326D|nr:uncharacterized protein LOC131936840 isoform X2 [Physella acuta]